MSTEKLIFGSDSMEIYICTQNNIVLSTTNEDIIQEDEYTCEA